MDKNSSKTPFTNTQCNYFELVLNAQYVTIPNFRKLKKNLLNKLLINSISVNPYLFAVFCVAIVTLLFLLLAVHRGKNAILNAKYALYDIYEATDYLFRKERL